MIYRCTLLSAAGIVAFTHMTDADCQHDAIQEATHAYRLAVLTGQTPYKEIIQTWANPMGEMAVYDADPVPCDGCQSPISPHGDRFCPDCARRAGM